MAKKKLGLGMIAALGVGGYLVYKKFIAKPAATKGYDEKAIITEQKATGKSTAQLLWDQQVQKNLGKKKK